MNEIAPRFERVLQFCLVVAALIHLAPVAGVVSAERLTSMYGTPIDGPDLAILMRHRAVLFGIVGGLLMAGAFQRALRSAAIVVGLVSAGSFLWIALSTCGYSERIGAIFTIDVVAVVLLAIAAALHAGRGN